MSKHGKTAIIAIAAVITVAATIFKQWDESIHNFLIGLGGARFELDRLVKSSRQVYLNTARYGATMDNIFAMTTGLVTNIGLIDKVNEDLIHSSMLISKRYGMSEDSTARLITLQKQSLGYTDNQVKSFALMANQMYKIANVLPSEIMKDIAENSESIATYTDGSAKSIIVSASYAKALGASFSDITSFAEKLLDIETSIEASINAQYYFGSRLNMGRARQLAIEGDISGAHRTVMKQISEMVNLNKMNI
jgi:hypothetical protein